LVSPLARIPHRAPTGFAALRSVEPLPTGHGHDRLHSVRAAISLSSFLRLVLRISDNRVIHEVIVGAVTITTNTTIHAAYFTGFRVW